MDDIKQRLRETSDTCFTSFENWSSNKKDGKSREALVEAIHELRKVASRLEIELAISERNEMAQKPIPIPPHRDSRRRTKPEDDNGDRGFAGSDDQKDDGQPRRPSRGGRKTARPES